MPGAPLLIWSNEAPAAGLGLLDRHPIRDVVGRHEVERPVGQTLPQRVAIGRGAQRWRDDEAGARDRIGVVVALLGQHEVVRAGLGRDANAGRLGTSDLVERRRRREVDDVDRRVRHPRERQRPGGRHGLDIARSRRRVVARRDVTTGQRRADGGVEQDRVLAMDLEHPAVAAHDPHRVEQASVGQPEVEDHERLGGRDAGLDRRGQLGQRVVAMAADREAQPDIDRGVAVGGGAPFADTGQQRALGRGRRSRSRVVERQEGRRAAEGRRHRILEEPIRLGVRRHPRMRVHVDDTGEDEQPGRVDDLVGARRGAAQVRLDRGDPPAIDRDIRDPRAAGGHDRPTANEQGGHAHSAVDGHRRRVRTTSGRHSTSRIEIACAPSHRQRRPISRRRSSQPSSATTVAK